MQPLPLPCQPHSAIICGQTGCGKTQFVLDELLHPDHGYYRDTFEVVFILCPTWKRNHTYLERLWLWRGPHASRFLFIDPRETARLAAGSFQCRRRHAHAISNRRYGGVKGTHKKRHVVRVGIQWASREAVAWVLVQKYNAVCKDLREQTKWVALFHCKDRFSFVDVLDENDVVLCELRTSLRTRLAECKHAKFLLKTDQPAAYIIC